MKRIIPCLLLLAALVALQGCACNPNNVVGSQAVTLRPQETDNWCWASTTQMVTAFLGHGRTQCDLANQRFNRNDCCQGTCPKNPACNMPGWTMFAESNFDTTASGTPLSWDQIKSQIYCAKKPMSYAYGPKSGGVGHVVVISGYFEVNGIRYVVITDPWNPCNGANRSITYEEYSNSGTTNHWETNYNITWKG
jgi:hypothetical protein